MERAFRNTGLPDQGWKLTDVTQCLYANMYRSARTLLQQRGLLGSRAKHSNGAEWISGPKNVRNEESNVQLLSLMQEK